jgi:hypothetical protein
MTNTTSSVRLTKRDYFTAILSKVDMDATYDISKGDATVKVSGADVAGFLNHELELLDRKNTVDKKPTAMQVANEGIKADIKAFLDAHKGEKYTVSALMKSVPAIADASNQKVSSLVRQMVLDGQADRIEDKRKAYFTAK